MDFHASLSNEELKAQGEKDRGCWEYGLSMFSFLK
jgi:hypothetical protein